MKTFTHRTSKLAGGKVTAATIRFLNTPGLMTEKHWPDVTSQHVDIVTITSNQTQSTEENHRGETGVTHLLMGSQE